MVRKVLETVIKNGARPAEPGEFTKRAFLNGKMDLSQAEAVIDVITSQNEYALKSSMSQLKGSVKRKIEEMRKEILYHTAFIETALDDPEHISVDGYGETLQTVTEGILRDWRISSGHQMTAGFKRGNPDRDRRKTECRKILFVECAFRKRESHCDRH